MADPSFDRAQWFPKHNAEIVQPLVDKVIGALREQGITTFYAIGFCFGAPFVFKAAIENIAKAAVVSHPSRLQIPGDLEVWYLSF